MASRPPSSLPLTRRILESSSVDLVDLQGKAFTITYAEIKKISMIKGLKILKRMGKKNEHLKSVKDVRVFLENLYFNVDESHLEPPQILTKLLAENETQRQELSQIYDRVEKFLELPVVQKEIVCDVDTDVPKVMSRQAQMSEQIKKGECPILVAGETSAGKSSFINLLLGANVLPADFFSCTGIFCTIRYGNKKQVVFSRSALLGSFSQGSAEEEKVDLEEDATAASEILRKYVNVSSPANQKYDHVDLYWPIELLRGNVYIVDSPGIGENQYLDKYSLTYLPKAAGFIFIIKADNAGGVNTRMVKLLKEARAQADGMRSAAALEDAVDRTCFDPNSALFVFNHWDRVEANTGEKERQQLIDDGLQKLGDAWPDLNIDKQVFFISVTEVAMSKEQSAGYPREFRKLLKAIQVLIPLGLKVKLQRHYDFLHDVTQSCSRQIMIKLRSSQDSAEQKLQKEQVLRRQLETMDTGFAGIIEDLNKRVDETLNKTVDIVFAHLTSRAARDKMTDFSSVDLPEGDTMEVVNLMAETTIRKQLENELIRWNTETKHLEYALKDLNNLVRKKFEILEDQIKLVEGIFLAEDANTFFSSAVHNFSPHRIDRPRISNVQKAAIGATSIIWVPLAIVAVIIILPIFGGLALRQSVLNQEDLENFKKDRTGRMSAAMTDFLRQITKDHVRRGLLGGFAQQLRNEVTKVATFIPDWIKANKRKMEELKNDNRTRSEILSIYNPLLSKLDKITGALDMFNTHYLRLFNFNIDNFAVTWDRSNCIASGSFADVHRCKLQTGKLSDSLRLSLTSSPMAAGPASDSETEVAVKVMKDMLNEHNAREYFLEEEILRRLCTSNHPNLVKWYGSFCQRLPSQGERLILVTELCDKSLRDLQAEDPSLVVSNCKAIGRSEKDLRRAFLFMCDMGRQVAEGLRFVHDKNYVHRDLKMENVLVSIRDLNPGDSIENPQICTPPKKIYTAKLCDLGLSKPLKQVSGTLCGTLLYVPPEVANRKGASPASDMYSFGLMLWELFHGRKVFENYLHYDQIEFLDALKKGSMELSYPDSGLMPSDLRTLCKMCTQLSPSKRVTARGAIEKLGFMALTENLSKYF